MWRSIDKHPLTGILTWAIYKPDPGYSPNLTVLNLVRYDTWNREFRLIADGTPISNVVCWQECETPNKPSQSEILDQKFT